MAERESPVRAITPASLCRVGGNEVSIEISLLVRVEVFLFVISYA